MRFIQFVDLKAQQAFVIELRASSHVAVGLTMPHAIRIKIPSPGETTGSIAVDHTDTASPIF